MGHQINLRYRMYLLLLLLGLVLLLAGRAEAATYCISTTGSDSNDGLDDGSPLCWLTFSKGNNTVVAGDTLNIKDGTYNQDFNWTKSGTSGSRIIVKATNDGQVTINGGGGASWSPVLNV